MQEKDLVASLVKTLRDGLPNFIIIKHSERIIGGTIGVPDISVTGNKDTTWLEAKFADPKFTSNGLQDLNMLRYENYAHCARYIIWDYRVHKEKRTLIVRPSNYKDWETKYEAIFDGFNHLAVLSFIRKVHNVEPT